MPKPFFHPIESRGLGASDAPTPEHALRVMHTASASANSVHGSALALTESKTRERVECMTKKKTSSIKRHALKSAAGRVRIGAASYFRDPQHAAQYAEIDALYAKMTPKKSAAVAKKAGIITADGKLGKLFR